MTSARTDEIASQRTAWRMHFSHCPLCHLPGDGLCPRGGVLAARVLGSMDRHELLISQAAGRMRLAS